MLIWMYKFEDGVEISVMNKELSTDELCKLTKLHGKVEVRMKKGKNYMEIKN